VNRNDLEAAYAAVKSDAQLKRSAEACQRWAGGSVEIKVVGDQPNASVDRPFAWFDVTRYEVLDWLDTLRAKRAAQLKALGIE
jgi:hypothetical protein